MKQLLWVFVVIFGLTACGGGEQASNPDVDESAYSDENRDDEYAEDGPLKNDPELGALSVDLAGEKHETLAYCSLSITRMSGGEIATIAVNLSMQAFDDQAGPDGDFGELNAGWGIDPDNGVVPMGFNYEPAVPEDTDEDGLGWVYDGADPRTSSLALSVDGEPYDFASSDPRGADNPRNAPHLWQTKLAMSANLVNPRDNGQMIRGQGNFDYEGLCSVSIRVLADR